MPLLPGGFHIDYRVLLAAKAVLAWAAAFLLLWDLRRVKPPSAPALRFCSRALVALSVLSFAAWWNFGALHGPGRPVHLHDLFHYYVGSKYYAELGYTRLYRCIAVEESERGRREEIAHRWTRNLVNNELEHRVPDAADRDDCLARFGAGRWQAFVVDIEWFRSHFTTVQWQAVQMDYGYNATPTWSALGHWLSVTAPASSGQILALAALDSVLVLLLALIVWRTFGWAPLCVAIIWWGLYESAGYAWLGGAFLRMDALFLIICAVCALKSGRAFMAGALAAAATLFRAFPVVLLAGIAARAIWAWRHDGFRTIRREYISFARGYAMGAAVLFIFTTLTWAGPWGSSMRPWKEFAANSRKHLATPATNQLGLRTVLSFSPQGRAAQIQDLWLDAPWDTWKAARTSTFQERAPLYWTLLALFLAGFVAAVGGQEDWIALVYALALLPIVMNLSNYYYSVFLAFGLLWPRDKPIGTAIILLAAVSTILPAVLERREDRYLVLSVGLVLFAYWLVIREVWPIFRPQRELKAPEGALRT